MVLMNYQFYKAIFTVNNEKKIADRQTYEDAITYNFQQMILYQKRCENVCQNRKKSQFFLWKNYKRSDKSKKRALKARYLKPLRSPCEFSDPGKLVIALLDQFLLGHPK